jgi:hypothetical protein
MSNVFDSMASKDEDERHLSPATEGEDCSSGSDIVSKPDVGSKTVAEQSQSPVNPSTTPRQTSEAVQELLRDGYIEESHKSESFRRTIVHQKAINAALEPLALTMQLDEHRGIAFLKIAQTKSSDSSADHDWSHPLVRRRRLTLEQSLLVAILRQAFVVHEQEVGVGEHPARIAVEELMPQFLTYFEDTGSDAKNESRLLSILDQLKVHGVVSEVDKNQEVTVRPLIAHLANPESLSALLDTLKQQTDIAKESNSHDVAKMEADANG